MNEPSTMSQLPFNLPLGVGKAKKIGTKIIRWFYGSVIVVSMVAFLAMAIFLALNLKDPAMTAVNIAALVLLGALLSFALVLLWIVGLKITTFFVHQYRLPSLIQWVQDVYGISMTKKQARPLLVGVGKFGALDYVSESAVVWTNKNVPVATSYSLTRADTTYFLFNESLGAPELPIEAKNIIELWEFFWSFSESVYIPVRLNSEIEDLNQYLNHHPQSKKFEFVNFASPLDEYKTLKIWGEEHAFTKDLQEGEELPYKIIQVNTMRNAITLLNHFNNDNLMVEIDFQGRQTLVKAGLLLDVIEMIDSSR